MSLSQLRFTELLNAFRSPEPTPGGGSASALGGAVGASLLVMVAGLPKPRTHGTEETERLTAAGARCGALADSLAALMDRDSHAYDLVVAAFRLPKGTENESTRAQHPDPGSAARGHRSAARRHARLRRGDRTCGRSGRVRKPQRGERCSGGAGIAPCGTSGRKGERGRQPREHQRRDIFSRDSSRGGATWPLKESAEPRLQ